MLYRFIHFWIMWGNDLYGFDCCELLNLHSYIIPAMPGG